MVNLSAEISEGQSRELEEVIDQNPGWNKALVVRSLLVYFLGLAPIEQENLVRTFGVKKEQKAENQRFNPMLIEYFKEGVNNN